jgi:hypothetical protein
MAIATGRLAAKLEGKAMWRAMASSFPKSYGTKKPAGIIDASGLRSRMARRRLSEWEG